MALAVSNTTTTIFHMRTSRARQLGAFAAPFVRLLSEFSAEPFLSQPFIRGLDSDEFVMPRTTSGLPKGLSPIFKAPGAQGFGRGLGRRQVTYRARRARPFLTSQDAEGLPFRGPYGPFVFNFNGKGNSQWLVSTAL